MTACSSVRKKPLDLRCSSLSTRSDVRATADAGMPTLVRSDSTSPGAPGACPPQRRAHESLFRTASCRHGSHRTRFVLHDGFPVTSPSVCHCASVKMPMNQDSSARTGEDAVRCGVRHGVPVTFEDASIGEVVHDRGRQQMAAALGLGLVDGLSLPGAPPVGERGQDRGRGEPRRKEVRVGAGVGDRRPVGPAADVGEPRQRAGLVSATGSRALWSCGAELARLVIDDLGVGPVARPRSRSPTSICPGEKLLATTSAHSMSLQASSLPFGLWRLIETERLLELTAGNRHCDRPRVHRHSMAPGAGPGPAACGSRCARPSRPTCRGTSPSAGRRPSSRSSPL